MKKPGFIAGVKYFLQGFRLIRAPGVRRFVVIPLAINMTLFIGALWLGVVYIDDWVTQLKQQWSTNFTGWLSWVNTVIDWISWIVIPLFVLAFLAMGDAAGKFNHVDTAHDVAAAVGQHLAVLGRQ